MKQIFILKEPIGKIKNPADIFKKIKRFKINYYQENFIIFYLNNSNQILKSENLFKGGVDSCLLCPKIIFGNALKNNAIKLIVAHNHPSNNLTPSEEDIEIKNKLSEAGKILDLKIIDFIIFNKKEFYSFKDEDNL
jgi:DNA repair protein RadC